MKHTNNDNTRGPGIKFVLDWVKGIKMDIPYSKWVMFAIGVYVLAAAFDKLATAIAVIASVLK